jgi:hypothetical protein
VAPTKDVVVRFVGDTGNLTRGADQVSGRLRGVASSLEGVMKLGAGLAGVAFFGTMIEEARDAERIGKQTEAVLRSTGNAAGLSAKQIGDLAGKLSEKTAVDDEVIQHGENVLLTFKNIRDEAGKGNDIFSQTTGVALDMSAALSESGDASDGLQSNMTRLGKALNDPIAGIGALTKVGVSFTTQQKDQIKALVEQGDVLGAQKIILAELQTEFGGMAEASADSIGKAQVSWGNFAEEVGGKVMPAVNAVSNWALTTGIPTLGRVADTVGAVVVPAFNALMSVGHGVVGVWQSLPGPIQAGAIAMGIWALAGDKVSGFLGRSAGPLKNLRDEMQLQQGLASLAGHEIGKFGASIAVLERDVPAIARMGTAFRGAKGDASGFGATVKGVAMAGVSGLKSAAGGLMGMLGGPWGLALGGATILLTAMMAQSDKAAAEQQKLADAGKSVAQAIAEQNGVINANVREKAAQAAEDAGLLAGAEKFGISTTRITDAMVGQKGALGALTSQLELYAEQHSRVDSSEGGAVVVFDREGAAALKLRDNLNATIGAKDGNVAASGRVAAAAQSTSVAQAAGTTSSELYRQAIERAGVEFDESAGLAEQLKAAIDAVTAAEMARMDTLESYEAAQDALTSSVQANGRTLDIHTEKGRANRDALEDVAKKSRDLMQADIDSGVPMNQALGRHNARIKALKDEAVKTFGAKSQAVNLINTYSKVPKDVRTAIKVQGYEEANRRMLDLSAKQTLLAKGMPITSSNLRAINKEKNQQRSGGFAGGGPVFGPGTGTSDSIVASLSNNEHVWTAKEVDAAGGHKAVGALRGAALKGMLPQFAKGGPVTWPFNVNVRKTKIPQFVPAMIGGGGNVQRWAPLVLQALAMLGQSSSLLPNVLRRMNQESGGNPRAINLWDSNAARGTPSIGLMQCVPLDSEILTRRGWLRHDQVQIGDETLGYNPATGCSEWTSITKVVHYENAPTIKIGNKHWSARVTPNHRWWSDTLVDERAQFESCPECGWRPRGSKAPSRGVQVHRRKKHGLANPRARRARLRGEFIRSDNFVDGHRIRVAAPAVTDRVLDLLPDEVRLIAWIIGDGHITNDGDATIYQSKPDMVALLRALLVDVPHTEDVRHRNANHLPAYAFRMRRAFGRELWKRSRIDELGHEGFVLALDAAQRHAYLDAMIQAEGHTADNFTRIAQANGPVQDAIKLAVFLEGYRPTFSANSAERNGHKPAGTVGMARPHVAPSMFNPAVELEPETVWCVKTALETWTMRQDGQIMLTGNTIGPTFAAYAGRFASRGIYDPFANIYAGLNYALHRYGSIQAAMDKPGGYKNGGWLKPGQMGYNETSKPEAVFTQEQLADLKRPEVHKHFHLTMQVANHAVDVRQQFAYMEAMAGL